MTFGQLALISLAGLVGPILSLPRWLSLPVVVGELAVGIAIGDTGLRLLSPRQPTFAFLAEVGFALVMFVAGTHVPMRDGALRAGLGRGVARAALVGVVAAPVGYALGRISGTGHGLLYAVLIASSSAALVIPALGHGAWEGIERSAMMVQVGVADAACIVMVPFAVDPAHATRAAMGAAAVLVAAAVAYVVLRHVEVRGWRRRVHDVSEDRLLAVELRVSLVLLFATAALAVWLGVSVMLAGFALGVAVAAVGEPRRLAKQLFALTEGFLGPVFFVWLGTSLDLRALADHPSALWLGLALGVAAVAVHALMAAARQPAAVAVCTAAQLGVPVAAATVGTHLGVLGPGEDVALLAGAMVTVVALAVASRRVRSAGPPRVVGRASPGAPPPA